MEPIRVFPTDSVEYGKLADAAERIREASGLDCKVETVYYDFREGWKWTTVIGYPEEGTNGVQLFSPKNQKDVLYGGEDSFHDAVAKAVGSLIRIYRNRIVIASRAEKERRSEHGQPTGPGEP